jgi:hypothetical protein
MNLEVQGNGWMIKHLWGDSGLDAEVWCVGGVESTAPTPGEDSENQFIPTLSIHCSELNVGMWTKFSGNTEAVYRVLDRRGTV